MNAIAATWLALLRFLSFGGWRRAVDVAAAAAREEERAAAAALIRRERAYWIGEGYGRVLLEVERRRSFGLRRGSL